MPVSMYNSGQINGPYIGPGDITTSFTGWWGFRAYSNTSIGSKAVQLRRASDSSVQDFVSLSTGKLDQTAISNFKGTSTLTVVKLYDQSGHGNDVSAAAQAAEAAFSLNILNGMGVWDNTVNLSLGSGYRTTTTFDMGTSVYSNYATYTASAGSSFQQISGVPGFIQLLAINWTTTSDITIDNNGSVIRFTSIPGGTSIWEIGAGVCNAQVGSVNASYLQFMNANTIQTANISGNSGAGTTSLVALAGLAGYFAEEGFLIQSSSGQLGWSSSLAGQLIQNSRGFWNF